MKIKQSISQSAKALVQSCPFMDASINFSSIHSFHHHHEHHLAH